MTTRATEGASAAALKELEVLDEENRILKETIAGAEVDVANLEEGLVAQGLDVPPASHPQKVAVPATSATNPEGYWSPEVAPVEGGLVEVLGPLSPIPNHDGTECFKWDNMMHGPATAHFKV